MVCDPSHAAAARRFGKVHRNVNNELIATADASRSAVERNHVQRRSRTGTHKEPHQRADEGQCRPRGHGLKFSRLAPTVLKHWMEFPFREVRIGFRRN